MGAKTLPGEYYWSSEVYEEETRKIFRKQWICVGRASDVPVPGDYFIYELDGENFIFERDDQNRVNCFYNVCRHRGTRLCEQSCGHVKQRIQCPYHAWTYETDGSLYAAPFMKGSSVFDKSLCSLPSYRLETWCGFLFINLDDSAPPLLEKMHTANQCLVNYRLNEQTEIMHYQTEWAGNWKLSAENSMEYYHHVGLHKDTVGGQLPAKNTYLPASPEDGSFTHERCRMDDAYIGGEDHPFNPMGNLDTFSDEDLYTGYMVYIFPAFTMAMRPNTNNWLSFSPAGISNTRVLGGYLVSNEVAREHPNIAEERRELILKVNEEDAKATTELAKVMRSSKAQRGPLSPFEGTLVEFYRYLARSLLDQNGSSP